MVSASHNPPADNGIKVFGANGAKLAPERQARIEAGLRGEIDRRELNPEQWNTSGYREIPTP